ncbi:hypothetical protein LR948_17480 [Roseivivax sp. GX 12232]|uniref:hypothetical protein n=1 Tax=Roseivivax sp. GX 12232 TaxID=2900547 RepID=UPI001E5E057E|nr:hypothetical protein [Roseivivax sp. GX 12232]MCE0507164.1 hypothetical protein [Roseivivax sp. GX 12232]
MQRRFRKLDQADFRARVTRLDPHYARHGVSRARPRAQSERPALWAMLGFSLSLCLTALVQNRAAISESLAQGSLGADHRLWLLGGVTALAIYGVLRLAAFALQCLFAKRARRGAPGGLVVGALGALLVLQVPSETYRAGLALLGAEGDRIARDASRGAQERLNIDAAELRFVSRTIE